MFNHSSLRDGLRVLRGSIRGALDLNNQKVLNTSLLTLFSSCSNHGRELCLLKSSAVQGRSLGWLPGEQKVLSAAEPAPAETWPKAMRTHSSRL